MLTPIPFAVGDRVEYYDGNPEFSGGLGTVQAVGVNGRGTLVFDVVWDDGIENGEYLLANLRRPDFQLSQEITVHFPAGPLTGIVTAVRPRITVLWTTGDHGSYSVAQLHELINLGK